LIATADKPTLLESTDEVRRAARARADEARRAARHPISRWYVCPAAGRLAAVLAPTRVRPVHLTLSGLAAGAIAAAVLVAHLHFAPWAGLLVLAAWFFDRADGRLARRQGTASAWGAWLDANVDELLDVALHAAVAAAAASLTESTLPWLLLAAFLSGKYLFLHGMATEEEGHVPGDSNESGCPSVCLGSSAASPQPAPSLSRAAWRILRAAYHLPGNADVRVHLLAAALLTGWLTAELAIVAVYYQVRWIARYALVARRLGGRR
jgi:phosphatidylglycerophosphate synthase